MTEQEWRMSNKGRFLYNFATDQMEEVKQFPTDDEEIKSKYIPQIPPLIGLYSTYREMGDSIPVAMANVLRVFAESIGEQ